MDIENLDAENLTIASVGAYLTEHPMPTANWFGPTGRRALSTWIDSDGSGWRVWDTDERAGIVDGMTLHTTSEQEAVEAFLRRALWHQKMRGSSSRGA
ncbi:hypothetical protein [Microbacterium luticocti]|uniref:hypothetical protein n=1 Tax=Microbacterium luticocti TaxID=451764 RepID=UPI00041641F2|nr:hypothetical protein [Microbacterium luticocti]